MSKIHQAMRRAEQEGKSGAPLPTRSTQEVVAKPFLTTAPGVLSAAPSAETDARSVADGMFDLSNLLEVTTVVDPKVVARTRDTYDKLGDRLGCLKVDALASGSDIRAVLLTSASDGEGKSLTATNVAIAVSRMSSQRVLLVDGNLRHPTVHKLLGMNPEMGLSDHLHGSCSAQQVIIKTDIPSLFIVSGGFTTKSPSELLNTVRMSHFLNIVRHQFEWVFVDAPAMIPEPDAELLSSFVDAVIFVAGTRSNPSSVLESVRLLRGKNVLGIVWNGGDQSSN